MKKLNFENILQFVNLLDDEEFEWLKEAVNEREIEENMDIEDKQTYDEKLSSKKVRQPGQPLILTKEQYEYLKEVVPRKSFPCPEPKERIKSAKTR